MLSRRLRFGVAGPTLALDRAFQITKAITTIAASAITPAPLIAPATIPVVRWSPFDVFSLFDVGAPVELAVCELVQVLAALVFDVVGADFVDTGEVPEGAADDLVEDGAEEAEVVVVVVVTVVVVGVVVVDVLVVVVWG